MVWLVQLRCKPAVEGLAMTLLPLCQNQDIRLEPIDSPSTTTFWHGFLSRWHRPQAFSAIPKHSWPSVLHRLQVGSRRANFPWAPMSQRSGIGDNKGYSLRQKSSNPAEPLVSPPKSPCPAHAESGQPA